MNLATVTSADLLRLAKLVERKESLLAAVARLDRELGALGSGNPAPAAVKVRKAVAKVPARAGKKGPRGHLKEAIIKLLQDAGKAGSSVRDLAAKLRAKRPNISVWFSTTGKTVKGIKKVGPGQYTWVG